MANTFVSPVEDEDVSKVDNEDEDKNEDEDEDVDKSAAAAASLSLWDSTLNPTPTLQI